MRVNSLSIALIMGSVSVVAYILIKFGLVTFRIAVYMILAAMAVILVAGWSQTIGNPLVGTGIGLLSVGLFWMLLRKPLEDYENRNKK